MKKILLLSIIPFLSWAQFQFIPMSADYASFYSSDSSAFVQVYLSIYQGNLTYQKTDDGKFSASFTNQLKLTKNGKIIKTFRHDYKNTTADTSRYQRYNQFVDVFNMEIPYGKYKATVQMLDNHSQLRGEYILEVKTITPAKKIFLSDMQLCTQLKHDTTQNMFFKNGLRVVPNPRNIFDVLEPMMYYYVELNNLPYSASEKHYYHFQYTITNSKGDTVRCGKDIRKPIIAPTLVEAGGLNVIALTRNIYFFNVRITDEHSGYSTTSRKKFMVYKPVKAKTNRQYSKTAIDEAYIPFTKAQLIEEFKEAQYLASSREIKVFKNLENAQAMKKFLTSFWHNRDKKGAVAPGSNRREYLERVEYTLEHFGSMGRKGWKTDRGRIYLIYGKPDEIERHINTMGTLPYTIWYYHNLEGGAMFVFADRNGFGEYELIHSTYRKELQNPNWQAIIHKNPSSMDPFQRQ